MNDSDLMRDQTRGQMARELLENELLQDALKAIKDEINKQWLQCPARDHEGKEALWQLAKTADKFEGILAGYVETGKLAADNLRRFEDKKGLMARLKVA